MPKTVLIAPDSFKGSLTSLEVCQTLAKGIKEVSPETEVIQLPLSDGGEGFLNVFQQAMNGDLVSVNVNGPLGEPLTAHYFVLQPDNIAIIEMAEAAGLMLVPPEKRNPFQTTTYGLGQLIKHALDRGIREFVIGIGGSATNDGGAGMAQALGIKCFDVDGNEINEHMNGELIGKCAGLSTDSLHSTIRESNFQVACDVENSLLGPNGATYTYAIQKGAREKDLPILERNMESFYHIVETGLGRTIIDVSGSGAAGGLGAGLLAFLNAKLESGTKLILDTVKIDEMLQTADLVITGEGRIDSQTLQGKLISGVLKRAQRHSVPVIGVAGRIELGQKELRELGFAESFSLVSAQIDEQYAIQHAGELLQKIGKQIAESVNSQREKNYINGMKKYFNQQIVR